MTNPRRHRARIAARTGALAMAAALAAAPASADLVLRLHNDTGETAKLVVQNIGLVEVGSGRNHEFRMQGDWFRAGMTSDATTVPTQLVANVEHRGGPHFQYCVWSVSYSVYAPGGASWGNVTITVQVDQNASGYDCIKGGQFTAPYHSSSTGNGATIDLVARRQ